MYCAKPRAACGLLLDGLEGEAEDGDGHRGDAQDPTEVVQFHAIVCRGRVVNAQQDDEDEHRRPNGGLVEVHHDICDGDDDERAGDFVSVAAEQGVDGVAAVELAYRQHVETGDEHADPTGHEVRVELRDGDPGSAICPFGVHPFDQPAHDDGIVKLYFVWRGDDGEVELFDAQVKNRRGDNESGERAGDADVEDLFAVGAHAVHADDGTHGADDAERHGDAQRVAGGDAVSHGLQEVAHFVREQNCEHGTHVGEAGDPVGTHHVEHDVWRLNKLRSPLGGTDPKGREARGDKQ